MTTRLRLDRPVLVSNLAAGAVCLLVAGLLALVGWGLLLVGAAYVVAAALFLATAYGRPGLGTRQELVAWVVPWLAACALLAWVLWPLGGGAVVGPLLGTGCFAVWQILALAVRQLNAWRAGRALLPVD